jgi:hypothetical protein
MATSHGSTPAALIEVPAVGTPAARELGPVAGDSRVPLRLLLTTSLGRGPLDGAWWPQSRDLEVELADLVDHLPARAGRVVRAVYSLPDWLPAPRRVRVARGFIKAGSFPHDDTHRIIVQTDGQYTVYLLIVPSDAAEGFARAAMQIAARPNNVLPAWAVLEAATGRNPDDSTAVLADEGGVAS